MHRDMQASLTFWSAFERRVGPADPDTDRFLVSDGSCGRSVGSLEIADALMAEIARRGKSIAVVRTGCDGRCFASVRVTFQQSRQPVLNWRRVDLRDIPSMIDAALQSNAAAAPDPDSEAFFHGQRRQLLADAGSINPESFEDAIRVGTYRALAEALTHSPADVVESIQAAGLLGMGGAYFPSWRKWQVCAGQPAPRYLVVNGEEGEPGVFKDRHLMEDQPHRLLEGAFIAAYAIGASQIYVFINGQARLSIERMQRAIDAVYRSRCVGESVLGTDFSCDVEIREGAGGYVLGEESVILESIEGYKPMPRFRPPHVAEHGLWGHPTVVNNVETLSRVPAVIRAASQIDSESTVDDGSKTKLISVTGDVQRPGLVEV
ncbi:MAG: hypothetical protein ACKVVP_06165, partial [Chloroflexota bacterium]